MIAINGLLACDGCFRGAPAVISLVICLGVLVGSIYMLLMSNFGARKAYLITMISLAAWMMIMSAVWTLGLPGTTPGTGPRGREAGWIPFTPSSQVAREDYASDVSSFPNGWDALPQGGTKVYPGKIDARGEFEVLRTKIEKSEAALAAKQNEQATDPGDWAFRLPGPPATPDEASIPPASAIRYKFVGGRLLFGATIPATAKHPETTVFAYRDKGLVFLYSTYFFLISLIALIVHLMLLARAETRENEERARLEPALA
ncbi:MAG: hypothetical protein ABR552_11410 [Actinomycetota bacterium]